MTDALRIDADDASTTNERRRRAPSRRSVLASAGSVVAGAVGLTGTASARRDDPATASGPASASGVRGDDGARDLASETQSSVTTTIAIETDASFADDYVGQFLVVRSTRYSPESTPGLTDCAGVNWTIQDTKSYDGLLVDRRSDDAQSVARTLFVSPEDRELTAGTTFVVSDATECGDYVALGVESVGSVSFADSTGDDGGAMPGFTGAGALAGVAGLLGAGVAARFGDD